MLTDFKNKRHLNKRIEVDKLVEIPKEPIQEADPPINYDLMKELFFDFDINDKFNSKSNFLYKLTRKGGWSYIEITNSSFTNETKNYSYAHTI